MTAFPIADELLVRSCGTLVGASLGTRAVESSVDLRCRFLRVGASTWPVERLGRPELKYQFGEHGGCLSSSD